MYVGGLLNNVGQHANIDHSNDVDNHVNFNLSNCLVPFKICLDFCDEYIPRYNFVNIRKILQHTCGNFSPPNKDRTITLLYINFDNNFAM